MFQTLTNFVLLNKTNVCTSVLHSDKMTADRFYSSLKSQYS